ncbi:extracellular solute-binding protein [Paenibacillus nasutitermitis]|uniref:Lipoprotein LipO n=1 Tax=Paenibacillus nasutitermitis TaxID=1652958 RepID=A0A917DVI8_9BACL|nr:extracellular solute-binding protein [Paenibacillus nasutitermitis]GGD72702.1 lipoprotein LipO [Paenibacillus nasutitermitis]
MTKRTHSLFIVVILIVTVFVTACSSNNKKDPETTPTSAPSGNGPAAAEGGKFDPPITLTTVGTVKPTVAYENGDSVDNNPWTREYEKRYGVKFNTLWTVDGSQWETKTNLMIATGDIPDFFQASPTQFKQLLEADLIEDLTATYESAPERAKNILNEGGPEALMSATVDGKLMAIPFTGAPKEGAPMIWLRTDWMEKLSLEPPKTMNDLLAIMDAFATKDPDGNNAADTFGMAVDKDFGTLTGFFNSYHAYHRIWIKDSADKLQYSSIQPEMKQALSVLQELFKKKQIDPEFGSKDFSKMAETVVSGKVGVVITHPYAGLYPFQSSVDQDPKAQWKAFPLVSADGQEPKKQASLGVSGYWVVKKGVKHPEVLFNMLDMWVELFYENKDLDINKQFVNGGSSGTNEIWQMNKIAAYRAYKNADQHLKIIKALETGDTSELTGDDQSAFSNIKGFLEGDRSKWGWNVIFGEGGSMGVTDQYRQSNDYVNDEFITAPLPVMSERMADLNKKELEVFTKIIIGASSIDDFDKFVAEWKKEGGDAITAEVNEWYATK